MRPGIRRQATKRMIVYFRPGRGATSMRRMRPVATSRNRTTMIGTCASGGSVPSQERRSFMNRPFVVDVDERGSRVKDGGPPGP
jgi:hypothetical protein